ncbi:hypothetical protein [Paraburkholderia sp. 2C]
MATPDRRRYGVDNSFLFRNVPDSFAALMFVTRVSLAICILWARGCVFYAKILPLPTSAMKKNERLAGVQGETRESKTRMHISHAD